jgi:hypothetical protein
MQHLDGNALAGDFASVFGADLTDMVGTCVYCHMRGPLAGIMVYRTAMGSVGRCPACGETLVVVVQHGDHPMVSLAGVRGLEAAEV